MLPADLLKSRNIAPYVYLDSQRPVSPRPFALYSAENVILDGDGKVTRIVDQSGNGLHLDIAAEGDPADLVPNSQNGRPCVDSLTSREWGYRYDFPQAVPLQEFEIFEVCKFTSADASYYCGAEWLWPAGGFVTWAGASDGERAAYAFGDTMIGNNTGSSQWPLDDFYVYRIRGICGLPDFASWQLYKYSVIFSAGNWQEQFTSEDASGNGNRVPNNRLLSFMRLGAGGNPGRIQWCERRVFSRLLSDPDSDDILNELRVKWAAN